MIDPNSMMGELIEQGQQVAQTQATDLAQRLKGQITGSVTAQTQGQANQQSAVGQNVEHVGADDGSAGRTAEMINDFYSPSDNTAVQPADPNKDQQQLAKVRQELSELHKTTYYDPLFAYENGKKPTVQDEKDKEEEQQKMHDLEFEKSKKDQAFAVQLAAQKVEKFPGMSG